MFRTCDAVREILNVGGRGRGLLPGRVDAPGNVVNAALKPFEPAVQRGAEIFQPCKAFFQACNGAGGIGFVRGDAGRKTGDGFFHLPDDLCLLLGLRVAGKAGGKACFQLVHRLLDFAAVAVLLGFKLADRCFQFLPLGGIAGVERLKSLLHFRTQRGIGAFDPGDRFFDQLVVRGFFAVDPADGAVQRINLNKRGRFHRAHTLVNQRHALAEKSGGGRGLFVGIVHLAHHRFQRGGKRGDLRSRLVGGFRHLVRNAGKPVMQTFDHLVGFVGGDLRLDALDPFAQADDMGAKLFKGFGLLVARQVDLGRGVVHRAGVFGLAPLRGVQPPRQVA